jgi:hypothetical protein
MDDNLSRTRSELRQHIRDTQVRVAMIRDRRHPGLPGERTSKASVDGLNDDDMIVHLIQHGLLLLELWRA